MGIRIEKNDAERTITTARRSGLIIIPNKQFEKWLLEPDKNNRKILDIFYENRINIIRTGTMIAYEKEGKKLGNYIEYKDPSTQRKYVIETKDAKGEKDVAIIADFYYIQGKPNFSFSVENNIILVNALKLMVLDFPTRSDFYSLDQNYFPVKPKVQDHKIVRWLYRRENSYIGFVVRYFESNFYLPYNSVVDLTQPNSKELFSLFYKIQNKEAAKKTIA